MRSLRLSLVQRTRELDDVSPDVILFPESVLETEMKRAAVAFPRALQVAAVVEGKRCRGCLLHKGVNRVAYRKIGSDGRTTGVGREPDQTPILRVKNLAIGMIICMDVQNAHFLRRVVVALREAPEPMKVLCIPADMGVEWFSDTVLEPNLRGVWVAVCNLARADGSTRCPSFVASPDGRKAQIRQAGTPLHVDLMLVH